MRSRLEARYAQHLDSYSPPTPWRYEPRAFASRQGQYLPDFEIIVPDGCPWFIEVRPTMELAYEALLPMQIILESEPDAALWVVTPTHYLESWPDDRVWRLRQMPKWTDWQS
jgi:hypothetical protein